MRRGTASASAIRKVVLGGCSNRASHLNQSGESTDSEAHFFLKPASHTLPNPASWEAAIPETHCNQLKYLVGVHGLEPWTR